MAENAAQYNKIYRRRGRCFDWDGESIEEYRDIY
jgi:hypothetical protein